MCRYLASRSRRAWRWALPACALAGLAAAVARPSASAPSATQRVLLLITGGTQGHLEPCGCGGQHKGGIAGRIEALRGLRAAHPGAVLVDTGDAVAGVGRQDELKFQATAMALQRIGYDAIVPGARDLALDPTFTASTMSALALPAVCANAQPALPWARAWVARIAGGVRVTIVGIVDPTLVRTTQGEMAAEAFRDPLSALRTWAPDIERESDLVVILAHAPVERARDIRRAFSKPCVIVAGHTEQADPPPPQAFPNAVLVDPGARGRYVITLGVGLGQTGVLTRYDFRAIPITAPDDPDAGSLSTLRFYQSRLAAEDLVGKTPQRPLPHGQRFVGSAECRACHGTAAAGWEASAHARAYQTLVAAKRAADPECVVCHTVGFGFQSGFSGTAGPSGLDTVGCECCHGPGNAHTANPHTRTSGNARSACAGCHTPERSPHYEPAGYLARIRHW